MINIIKNYIIKLMKQYWKEKDQTIQGKCPIHNYTIPKNQNQNQKNNRINNITSPSYTQQQSQINSSQRKSTQTRSDDINARYNNNNINSNQNKNISNNYYNYDNSNYIEVNYNNQSKKNMNEDSNSNINSDDYTNNYSFYISGSSKPKVILNFPEKNDHSNQSITQSKYIYQTLNIPRGRNNQNQKYINSNSNYNVNSYNNRIINQNNSSPFFIRAEDNEPVIYNAPKNRQSLVQRKVVNEEYNEGNRIYYTTEPRDDLRSINISQSQNYIRNNYQQQPRPTIRQIDNYNSNANNRRYYNPNVNPNQNRHNIYPSDDYYDSYQERSFNTPYIQRSYTSNSNQDYSRQRGRIIEPNYSQNERTDMSYHYPLNKTETNSPRYRAPYFDYSSDFSNEGNLYQNNNWERPSEFYSNNALRNKRGFKYKYENEINDSIYNAPGPYNQNREIDYYYEDNRGSFLSERPFTQTNTYIQRDEKGRKYRVYTQDLPMNRNYNSNNNTFEYGDEYNNPNNRRMNRNPPRAYKNSMKQNDYRDQEQRYKFKDRNNNSRIHNAHKSRSKSKKKHKKYYNRGVIQKENFINRNATQPRYQRGRNSYYDPEETINMKNINRYNGNDEEEQMYAPRQLTRSKDNSRRLSNDYNMKTRQKNENNYEYPQEEEIEENDELYKKIETEISEKYYDNEGNYLGEKKTITMKKVPIEGYPQQNEEEIYEEREQEENENKNGNKYTSYKSTHKKVTNRAIPKDQSSSVQKNNYKGSKYLSYFHNTNTNNKVYREIIGSPENKEDSTEKEKIKNKNKKHKKFIIYGIESKNLNVPFEDIQNAQKE